MATATKYRDYPNGTDPVIFTIPLSTAAFVRIAEAQQRTDSKGKPRGEAKYNLTFLLDRSVPKVDTVVSQIKAEATRLMNARFPDTDWANARNFYRCFGTQKDLKKVYDGFEGMWWLKAADSNRPVVLGLKGQEVSSEDTDFPHSTDVVCGRVSLYTFDNESIGFNANLISIRTLKIGKRNVGGGGSRRSVEEEMAALRAEEDAAMDQAIANQPAKDPFED